APETRILARQDLAEQTALQPGIIADRGAVTAAGVAEHGASLRHLSHPLRLSLLIRSLEELISVPIADAALGTRGQHHVGGRLIRDGPVRPIRLDRIVPRAGVILPEVEEGGAAEAGAELPVAPGPTPAVVRRPRQLRVAGVAGPQVEDAVHHEQA